MLGVEVGEIGKMKVREACLGEEVEVSLGRRGMGWGVVEVRVLLGCLRMGLRRGLEVEGTKMMDGSLHSSSKVAFLPMQSLWNLLLFITLVLCSLLLSKFLTFAKTLTEFSFCCFRIPHFSLAYLQFSTLKQLFRVVFLAQVHRLELVFFF